MRILQAEQHRSDNEKIQVRKPLDQNESSAPELQTESPSFSPNGHKSILRLIREERGVSQRGLAIKMGMSRNRLRRLENNPWQRLSLGDLDSLSHVLDIRLEDLIFRFNGFERNSFSRTSETKPIYTVELPEEVRLLSFVKRNQTRFIGILEIPPQKTVSRENAPQGDSVLGYILRGQVLLSLPGKDLIFQRGECFSWEGRVPYELYNSHQFRFLRVMIMTLGAIGP